MVGKRDESPCFGTFLQYLYTRDSDFCLGNSTFGAIVRQRTIARGENPCFGTLLG